MSNNGMDTYSYKGWLNSDSFWKRAFGIFGYYLVASLVISLILIIALMVLSMLFAVVSVFIFGMAAGL